MTESDQKLLTHLPFPVDFWVSAGFWNIWLIARLDSCNSNPFQDDVVFYIPLFQEYGDYYQAFNGFHYF